MCISPMHKISLASQSSHQLQAASIDGRDYAIASGECQEVKTTLWTLKKKKSIHCKVRNMTISKLCLAL